MLSKERKANVKIYNYFNLDMSVRYAKHMYII